MLIPIQGNNESAGSEPLAVARYHNIPPPELPLPKCSQETVVEDANQAGKEGMLKSLANRIKQAIPPELLSWQMVVLGGQTLCCAAGIALTVLSGGGVPVLLLAGVGLAIAIADVACLIYDRQHKLPMAHDSIGNAVYFLAHRFFDERRSMDIASVVSLGGRFLLTATVMTHQIWCGPLALDSRLLEGAAKVSYGLLAFSRYGATGMSMTSMNISDPFFRLLARFNAGSEEENA